MKSIRESHEEEQSEARLMESFEVFKATMEKINKEHNESQARIRRDSRLAMWAIVVIAIAAVFSPIVSLIIKNLWR